MLQADEQQDQDKAPWCEGVWDIPEPQITPLHVMGRLQ